MTVYQLEDGDTPRPGFNLVRVPDSNGNILRFAVKPSGKCTTCWSTGWMKLSDQVQPCECVAAQVRKHTQGGLSWARQH